MPQFMSEFLEVSKVTLTVGVHSFHIPSLLPGPLPATQLQYQLTYITSDIKRQRASSNPIHMVISVRE